MNTIVCTTMPGIRYCTYSRGLPASAPPKRYVNISVIISGNAVTSKSWKGTCLIFSIARQPSVTVAASAPAAGGRCVVASMLMRGRAGLVLGGLAGEREEDVVEARLPERELRDVDAGARERRERVGDAAV